MTAFGQWLLGILKDLLQFFVDLPVQVAQWLWGALLELLSTSPIVGMVETGESLLSQIPQSVWFFMNMFQVPMGIVTMLTAYGVRFLIRRIPFIG